LPFAFGIRVRLVIHMVFQWGIAGRFALRLFFRPVGFVIRKLGRVRILLVGQCILRRSYRPDGFAYWFVSFGGAT